MTEKNEGSHSIIETVEAVIAQGRQLQVIDRPIDWHERAYNSHHKLAPELLIVQGQDILQSMPYDEVDAYIREAKKGDPDALTQMRQARRLFIVARDSIMLGVQQEPPVMLDPLLTLCRSLGEVADTNGANHQEAKESLATLHDVPGITLRTAEVASRSLLSKRVHRHLHTHELTSQSESRQASHSEYHRWRKGFRRIVNMYTIHAATTGAPTDEAFAARGIALNNHYGHINDSL